MRKSGALPSATNDVEKKKKECANAVNTYKYLQRPNAVKSKETND